MGTKVPNRKCEIDDVQETDETLTGRAGLAPYVAYLKSHDLPDMLAEQFSDLRKSRKGIELWEASGTNAVFLLRRHEPLDQ